MKKTCNESGNIIDEGAAPSGEGENALKSEKNNSTGWSLKARMVVAISIIVVIVSTIIMGIITLQIRKDKPEIVEDVKQKIEETAQEINNDIKEAQQDIETDITKVIQERPQEQKASFKSTYSSEQRKMDASAPYGYGMTNIPAGVNDSKTMYRDDIGRIHFFGKGNLIKE